MKKQFVIILGGITLLVAGCTPVSGLLGQRPEESPFGFKIRLRGDKEGVRVEAEDQATAFCESEGLRYAFGRIVFRDRIDLGFEIYTCDFYFTCEETQKTQKATIPTFKFEKLKLPEREGANRQETPSQERKVTKSVPPAMVPTIKVSDNSLSKRQVGSFTRTKKQAPAGAAGVQISSGKKRYVPGEVERLAPPGEDEPNILVGKVFEERLED